MYIAERKPLQMAQSCISFSKRYMQVNTLNFIVLTFSAY